MRGHSRVCPSMCRGRGRIKRDLEGRGPHTGLLAAPQSAPRGQPRAEEPCPAARGDLANAASRPGPVPHQPSEGTGHLRSSCWFDTSAFVQCCTLVQIATAGCLASCLDPPFRRRTPGQVRQSQPHDLFATSGLSSVDFHLGATCRQSNGNLRQRHLLLSPRALHVGA